MTSTLDQLAPGLTSKLNLLFDLLLWIALLIAAGAAPPFLAVFAGLCVWVVLGVLLRHYDAWAYGRSPALDAGALCVMTMVMMTVMVPLSRLLTGVPHTGQIAAVGLTCWPVLTAVRLLVFRAVSLKEAPLDEVLIVGAGALARATAEDLRRAGKRRVVGHLRFDGEAGDAGSLGLAGDLEEVLRGLPVSEVYIAGPPLTKGSEVQTAIRVCERFGVPFAVPISGFRFDRARPVGAGVSDGYLHYLSVELKPHQRAAKRLFDVASAGGALLVLSPLLLVVAALVKLTSKGPVLFQQQRSGLHGRPFGMLKFRSMRQGAEAERALLEAKNEQQGPVFKMQCDPRVTPVGRFLRKHSIDELPQLFNVLRGEMSIVGPRPPLPKEVAQYESWQRRRLSVRPGLTCIWQVSGRNQLSFEEWMVLDMQYIDRWSLANDLELILKTVPVVLVGRGAS